MRLQLISTMKIWRTSDCRDSDKPNSSQIFPHSVSTLNEWIKGCKIIKSMKCGEPINPCVDRQPQHEFYYFSRINCKFECVCDDRNKRQTPMRNSSIIRHVHMKHFPTLIAILKSHNSFYYHSLIVARKEFRSVLASGGRSPHDLGLGLLARAVFSLVNPRAASN